MRADGALTIGTLDGANIEIRQAVGEENFFCFGLTADEVVRRKADGYHPREVYESTPELRVAIDMIGSGALSPDDPGRFGLLVRSLLDHDEYMLLADFPDYAACQERAGRTFNDRDRWTRMSILNTARCGRFSSDRTIREYCRDIWKVEPVAITLENP